MSDVALLLATVGDAVDRAAREPGGERVLWRALADIGLTALGVPESAGGSGGTLADALLVTRRLAAAPIAVPYLESAVLGGWLRWRAGLPPGTGVAAVASGGSLAATPAIDGGAVLDGSARAVRWAASAGELVVLAPAAAGAVVAVLVPGKYDAVARPDTDGVDVATVAVRDLALGPERAREVGPDVAGLLRLRGALGAACVLTGAMGAALDLAVEYAGTRRQFGRALLDFQAIKHALVVATAEYRVASAATERAVEASAAAPDPLAIAVAKARASHAAGVVARVAHQVHGAVGLTEEHALWRYTTRLWVHSDRYGSQAEWEAFAGRRVRGAGRFWPLLSGQATSSSTSAPWSPATAGTGAAVR